MKNLRMSQLLFQYRFKTATTRIKVHQFQEILTDYKAHGEPKLLFQNPLKQQQQPFFFFEMQRKCKYPLRIIHFTIIPNRYMNILKEGLLLSLTPQSMAAIFFWHCALLCHYYQSIALCRATLPAGTLSFTD